MGLRERGPGVVVVAHRLPVQVVERDGERTWAPSPGGLVSALRPLLGPGDTWVGTLGAAGTFDGRLAAAEAGVDADFRLEAVPLTQEEVEDYYHGFANQIVWPLFHDFLPYCQYRAQYLEAYHRVNARFSDRVVEAAAPGDLVWVHDYQLMHVGLGMRKRGWRGRIGFFLHIPFPSSDILGRFPWHVELLEALLAYDHVGLQSPRDARNLVRSLEVATGVQVIQHGNAANGNAWTVQHEGRMVRIESMPIGLDYNGVQAEWPPDRLRHAQARRERGMKYLLGLERLDYTKGIPERLEAFDRLLERHPGLRGRVTFIQHVDPSRQDIARYARLREDIEKQVGRINGRYGNLFWSPIHYSYRHLSRDEVLALLSLADVAVVTPLRDGMNLVAKEYCATRSDEDGVLVLSQFTGAAHQLTDALLVNPHDVDALAQTLHDALCMPVEERRRRMRSMRRIVRETDVQHWAQYALERLEDAVHVTA